MITQSQYDVHFQAIRELYVKISLLNKKLRKIDEIQGVALGGSIDINADSDIRRTCNLDIVVKDSSFLIGEDKKIWIDKRFKLEIGIKSFKTDEIIWFNMGIFCVDSPSLSYDANTKNLSLNGLDLMCLLNGDLGGELSNPVIINEETPISEAIKNTAETLGDVKKLDVQDPDRTIPYRIEKDAGNTVYELLAEIRDLYKDWEMFFTETGVFTYRRIKNRDNDPIAIDFTEIKQDLIKSYNIDKNFQNVKNKIVVYGEMMDDGSQAHVVKENDDPDSPFSTDKLGNIVKVVSGENIYTEDQAETRANYELWKHNNLNERIDIDCLPIYFLNANRIIKIDKPEIEIEGRYLIDNLSIPLDISGIMNISGYKIY